MVQIHNTKTQKASNLYYLSKKSDKFRLVGFFYPSLQAWYIIKDGADKRRWLNAAGRLGNTIFSLDLRRGTLVYVQNDDEDILEIQ